MEVFPKFDGRSLYFSFNNTDESIYLQIMVEERKLKNTEKKANNEIKTPLPPPPIPPKGCVYTCMLV